MPYRELMGLPMRAFWQLSGYVDRLKADEARLQLELGTAVTNPESAASMREYLETVAPEPVKMTVQAQIEASAERDTMGFEELRSLAM